MPNVKIYTTESCAYCKMAKEFFAEKNVEYEAKDVTEDQAAREEMIQKSGQMGVPVIVVSKEGEEDKIMVGFDKDKLSAALGIA
jgi:glutaredoxin-like YruB-family protein